MKNRKMTNKNKRALKELLDYLVKSGDTTFNDMGKHCFSVEEKEFIKEYFNKNSNNCIEEKKK